jgi:K+/H+ antiporter YhaU regulatory subunit KhtT
MVNFRFRSFPSALALIALALAVAPGDCADQPKDPPKKEEGKQPDPLQALKEAFAKGVTTTPIEPKELPKEIGEGAAKVRPGATVKKAQKMEIKQTLKYVAFDKPQVQSYQAVVNNDGKRTLVQLATDGKKLNSRRAADNKEPAKEVDAPKEIDIPEKAKKAVKAIKDLYPDAVVIEITTEVYQDPSGTVDILTYEIEFLLKGSKREMVASPDGIVPRVWKPIAEKDLPKAVAETLAKEGGKLESVAQFEIRAGLQFAPLEKSRTVYQLEMEKDSASSKLSLRADGSLVPPPARPGPQNRTYLGVSFEKDSTTISQVVKDGPADQAGIKVGDKLLMVGDAKIGAVSDLLKVLQSANPGTVVKVRLRRGDQTVTVSVKLGASSAP